MDESIRRYYNYMPVHRSKIMYQEEYKQTLLTVTEKLSEVASMVENEYMKSKAPGTIIPFNQIRA